MTNLGYSALLFIGLARPPPDLDFQRSTFYRQNCGSQGEIVTPEGTPHLHLHLHTCGGSDLENVGSPLPPTLQA